MPSLKIIRQVVNFANGSKKEQTILEIWHKQRSTVHRIYTLLLDNDALEGGDEIIYEEKKKIQKYHLCSGCRKRAIENPEQTKCSSCKQPTKVKNALPLDQAALINATPSLQQKRDTLKAEKSKPKPDYSKYYKHSVNGSFDDKPYETHMRRD